MRRVTTIAIAMALVASLSAVATSYAITPAADVVVEAPPIDEELNTAQQVLAWVASVVIGLLGIVASTFILRGNAYLKSKTGLTLGTDEQLLLWADNAIAYAEEKSSALAKRGAARLTGPAKMEEAMQFMIDRVKERGLEDIAEGKMRDYITARLGARKLPSPPPAPLPVARVIER